MDYLRDLNNNIAIETSNDFIDICPKLNTLVIFESALVQHEVLPAFDCDRVAITHWMY